MKAEVIKMIKKVEGKVAVTNTNKRVEGIIISPEGDASTIDKELLTKVIALDEAGQANDVDLATKLFEDLQATIYNIGKVKADDYGK